MAGTALVVIEGFSPDCGGDKEPTHIMVYPSIHIFHDHNAEGACQDFVVDAEMGSLWPEETLVDARAVLEEFREAKAGCGSSKYWCFTIDRDGNVVERV